MKLFLTSSPIGIYRSNEPLDYKGFNPANGMVEELRRFWKENSRCILISAFPDEYEVNDRMRSDFEGIVKDTGLSLSCMDICDTRNGKEMADALHSYDFVILGGGHVPTENAFFKSISLTERFRGYEGIVMGISAGTMNCARIVYAQPEMPGEAADPNFDRFIPGLGLTEFNILPHYNAVKHDVIDGMRLIEDIAFSDSFGHTIYALTDGSYLLQTEDGAEIRGEAYRIRDGKIVQICTNGEVVLVNMESANTLKNTMMERRSIRKYSGEIIPEEKLEMILQAGLLAPTSRDLRPCEFFAVEDKEVLKALSASKKAGAAMLSKAAAAIVVAADAEKADTWIEDSSIALSYMNLMAAAQGIGSCWVQIHLRKAADGQDAEDKVRGILSLEDKYRIVGILSLGIPAETRPPQELSALEYSKIYRV